VKGVASASPRIEPPIIIAIVASSPAVDSPMADIFLNDAREDLDKARRIATVLQARGWSVWWDRRLRGGMDFTCDHPAAAG